MPKKECTMAEPTDAELKQWLERYPGGPPITLYHVDATGGFTKALVDSGGQINLNSSEFWLTTDVESRKGFKGGAGLDGCIIGLELDRRLVLLLRDVALSQQQAGQVQDLMNTIAKVLKRGNATGDVLKVPKVNFEGGGSRAGPLPEGQVNISLQVKDNWRWLNRLVQISTRRVTRNTLDGSRAPGGQVVPLAEWRYSNGAPIEATRPPEPSPRLEPLNPTAGMNAERAQAYAGGAILLAQCAMWIASEIHSSKQADRARKALEGEWHNIMRHRVEVPTDGVLLRYEYETLGVPQDGHDSIAQALPEFVWLYVLYGKTRDEAERSLIFDPEHREQLGKGRTTPSQIYRWIPPLVAPSVTEIVTPWPKVAVGMFAAHKAFLQQVEFDYYWGFDDEQQIRLSVPADASPKFVILAPPSKIWANLSVYQERWIWPPLVTRRTASGENLVAIDLDPGLSIMFDDVAAVPVFPADHDTEELFSRTPATIDNSHFLEWGCYNMDKLRWVRPENIVILRSIAAIGQTTSDIKSTRVQINAPAPAAPAPPKPDPKFAPKASELAPRALWGTEHRREADGDLPVWQRVPPSARRIYIVGRNDGLSLISKKLYGDANRWPKIQEANKSRVDPKTHTIYAGQVLVIPDEQQPAEPSPAPQSKDPNIA
jgi:hypothetical protein